MIKPVDPESLKEGDIICFKLSEPTSITHRIKSITDEGFVTKGDANEDPDQWIVKKESVIGKAIFTIPYVGYIGYFVRTPTGFIVSHNTRHTTHHRRNKKHHQIPKNHQKQHKQ